MGTRTITHANFAETVRQGIVFIDWWASWCGPCRAFTPVYESVAARHPDIVFGKVDTEAEPGLAEGFGIRSIPTLMILRDGVLLHSRPGALPAPALEELVERVRELDMDEVRRRIAAAEGAEAGAPGRSG